MSSLTNTGGHPATPSAPRTEGAERPSQSRPEFFRLPKSGGDQVYTEDDLTRALDELRDRTHFWNNVEPDFNPLSASKDALIERGLQPLPDETDPLQGQRLAFWKKFYSPHLQWMQASYLPLVPGQYLQTAQFRVVSAASLHESSRNWSGLYISPRDGRMIVEVRGEWNVPTVNFPAGAIPAVNERRSSTWIGLDGQGRYFDSSLPQIGTEQFIDRTLGPITRTTQVFVDWWYRGATLPLPSVPLLVSPGDVVLASITVVSTTAVTFYIKNQSTGIALSPWTVTAPWSPMPTGPSPTQVRVSGATAEWVMERPTKTTDDFWELPSFNTINFVDCGASSALAPGGSLQDETLYGARRIKAKRLQSIPPLLRTLVTSEPNSIIWPPREQQPHSFDVDFVP